MHKPIHAAAMVAEAGGFGRSLYVVSGALRAGAYERVKPDLASREPGADDRTRLLSTG